MEKPIVVDIAPKKNQRITEDAIEHVEATRELDFPGVMLEARLACASSRHVLHVRYEEQPCESEVLGSHATHRRHVGKSIC
mgnify:FL=1